MNLAPEIIQHDEAEVLVMLHIDTLKSDGSARVYRRTWKRWRAFLGAVPAEKANSLHVGKFFKERANHEGDKPRRGGSDRLAGWTLRGEHSCLRRIYDVLRDNGAVTINPFRIFKPGVEFNPKRNQKRPTELTDFAKVKELLSLPAHTPRGIMERAYLAVFYGAGLRISSVLALKMGDVVTKLDSTGAPLTYLRVHSIKATGERDQPLLGGVEEPILRYYEQRRKEGAGDDAALFVLYHRSCGNDGISDSAARRLFKKLCASVGLPDSVTPHSARATVITKCSVEGLTAREIQTLSGHESVRSVEKYIKDALIVESHPARKVGW